MKKYSKVNANRMFLCKLSTKHKAPNGGCRSSPPFGYKKNIKTLGFFKKSPKPKKLLNHSVGTRRVAEVHPIKTTWANFVHKCVATISSRSGSIFFLWSKISTPTLDYILAYRHISIFYCSKFIIDSIKEKIISSFSRTLIILKSFFNKLIFTIHSTFFYLLKELLPTKNSLIIC